MGGRYLYTTDTSSPQPISPKCRAILFFYVRASLRDQYVEEVFAYGPLQKMEFSEQRLVAFWSIICRANYPLVRLTASEGELGSARAETPPRPARVEISSHHTAPNSWQTHVLTHKHTHTHACTPCAQRQQQQLDAASAWRTHKHTQSRRVVWKRLLTVVEQLTFKTSLFRPGGTCKANVRWINLDFFFFQSARKLTNTWF